MFSLMTGFWKWLTSKTELRFLIVGLDNAGKTTTLEQLKRIYPSKTPKLSLNHVVPTIGLNLCNVDFDRSTNGVFWDLGGQLMLRGIWEKHYNECDGIVFILDSTDGNRFHEVLSTLEKLVHHPIVRERTVPISLLINKQDDEEYAFEMTTILEYLGLKNCLECQKSQNGKPPSTMIISYPGLSSKKRNTDISSLSLTLSTTSLSHLLQEDSTGPTLVCVSASSAIENINIKPAIDCLVNAARESIARKLH